MNSTAKKILLISAKNAVNALLTNIAASQFWPLVFNMHSKAGLLAIGKLVGSVVFAREAMVWVPKILEWSQSNGHQ